jgi:putative drug exporter of the RND superfamily
MPTLARWCFRHRRIVLGIWLITLIVVVGAAGSAKSAYSNQFSLPDTPSSEALTILQHDFPSASGDADQLVVETTKGTVNGAEKPRIEAMLAKVASLPHVDSVTSPYNAPGQISHSGTIAFATIHFNAQATDLPDAAVERVVTTAQAARGPGLEVGLGGQAVESATSKQGSSGTGIGVLFALIVLVIVFGAFFAALTPLITALIAIAIGYSITTLLSHLFAIASFAPILGVLIGLGVGVDYALFIVTRHRSGLRAGRSSEEAAVIAVNTAGRAVFFAGLTVCIALLGQFVLGVSFLYGVAVSSTITVALTMVAALTLLPALLGFFDKRVLSRRERRRIAASGPESEHVDSGWWYRWSRSVERRPAIRAVAAFAVVVLVALPFFSMRLGLADAGSDAAGSTTRVAYDLLAKGFGPGFSGPLQLVTTIDSTTQLASFTRLADEVARQPGLVRDGAPQPVLSPNGKAAIAVVYPTSSPQAAGTSSLLQRLRTDVVPQAERGTGLHVLIGGATAEQTDFSQILSSKLPQFVAVVVVLAFLLLMLVFRSFLIPVVASVMNLLSVGAALGVMTAVFEWGWGRSLLGFNGSVPVEVFIPVIMFSVLFGLSMDYEVFLVSRMYEEWHRSKDNRRAVTLGQAETGRVITAAAIIMILVFLSFLLGGSVIIQEFGIGLAAAIIIDAFVVRTVLVPSLMHVFGRANWWLPPWLDRRLPHLNVEASDPPVDELELVDALP